MTRRKTTRTAAAENHQAVTPIEATLTRDVVSLLGERLHLSTDRDERLRYSGSHHLTLPLKWISRHDSVVGHALLTVSSDLVTTHSPIYAVRCTEVLRAISRNGFFAQPPASLAELERQFTSLKTSYFAFLRTSLRRLAELAPELFSDDLMSFLTTDSVKWEEHGQGPYFALFTNCPERGALTDQEIQNLHTALNAAYSRGEVPLYEFTVVWMFMATGLRPIQIARMTASDVQIYDGPGGKEVNLRVPLAKGEKTSRTEYWIRRAPTVLADLLVTYLDNANLAPGDSLFGLTNKGLGSLVRDTAGALDTHSDRLGTQIPLTPYRLRYTMATRALAQGASDWEVARLLTHRTTDCIAYYRASMPSLQKPVRDALEAEMGFFARAFQGRLIGSLEECIRSDKDGAAIVDFLHLTVPATLGACGTLAQCYQNAPVACLTCPFFEPLRDAPWDELRASLVTDMERETEPKIRDINLMAINAIDGIRAQIAEGAAA